MALFFLEMQKWRENWQEQWEEFLADARQHMKEVLQPERSDHSLFVQGSGLDSSDEGVIPYSEHMEDGRIVYNGVVFTCNPQEHAICLGDMGDPRQVLTIPLAGGGVLKVNRSEIGSLARAMGMFCPEDVGNILRAIAEDQQVQANQYAIEEEENQTVEEMVS